MNKLQEPQYLPFRKRPTRSTSRLSSEEPEPSKAKKSQIDEIVNKNLSTNDTEHTENFCENNSSEDSVKETTNIGIQQNSGSDNNKNVSEVTSTCNNDTVHNANSVAGSPSTVADTDIEIVQEETQDSAITVTSATESTCSDKKKVAALCNDLIDTGENKKPLDIFTEITGPRWFEADGCNITKPIVPTRLRDAFSYLPIFEKPKSRDELPEFLNEKLQEFVGSGLNDEEFFKLSQVCSPNLLRTGKEPEFKLSLGKSVFNDEMPENDTSEQWEGRELHLHKKLKMRKQRDHANRYNRYMKYRGVRIIPMSHYASEEADNNYEPDLEPGHDLVFHIRIYRPFPFVSGKQLRNCNRHSLFSRDMVMLGRQTLTELRDRMVCSNDVDMRLDVSDRIDDPIPTNVKEIFPSGFLFINNVFYIDTRAGCHDISQCIRQWGARRQLGTFPVRAMCSARLDQIPVRLGHPEVYMHQGNCEHLFTFSAVRVLGAHDPLSARSFPAHCALAHNQSVYCMTCADFAAKWLTKNCDRVPFDPAYFCDPCLRLYLYKDGKKTGDFQVYSYRGNEINVLKPQG